MKSDILYEGDKVKVTYLHSPEQGKEDEVVSYQDHELWLKNMDGEWGRHIIQKGILKELSDIADDKYEISLMLERVGVSSFYDIAREGITLEEVSEAVLEAYEREVEEIERLGGEMAQRTYLG